MISPSAWAIIGESDRISTSLACNKVTEGWEICSPLKTVGSIRKSPHRDIPWTTNISKYKKLFNRVRLGGYSYIIGVLKVLLNYKPTNVELKIDSKLLKIPKVWLIAVANSPFYAGGMLICPNARSDDGLFEICIVQGISRWGLLRILPTVFKGEHISHPSVTLLQAREVEILSDSPMIAHADGEIICETPVNLNVNEKSLYVL